MFRCICDNCEADLPVEHTAKEYEYDSYYAEITVSSGEKDTNGRAERCTIRGHLCPKCAKSIERIDFVGFWYIFFKGFNGGE